MSRLPTILITLPLLVACATSPQPATRTETITRDRAVWIPVPRQYTEPLPIPTPPPWAIRVEDLEDLLERALQQLEQANADRADVGRLSPPESED